jgi:Rod binding domain-containing protein
MATVSMPALGSGLAGTSVAAKSGAAGAAGNATGAARTAAVQFESVFLSKVLGEMFSSIGGDGPLGTAGPGGAIWRSMLTDQFAKQFAQHGGIGIADAVQRELVSLQESGR